MRKYEPEILMGLILSLTAALLVSLTGAASAPEAPQAVLAAAEMPTGSGSFDQMQTVRMQCDECVRTLTLRDYLIGVVMSEMPLSYEQEALRAQAIASRTYALHCRKHPNADVCSDGCCCQCWADDECLEERFGAEYMTLREKAAQAVDSTDAMVLEYRGALIDATFFACSGGMTEDAVEVWGREVPYLRSVASPGEETASNYHSRSAWSGEDFAAIIHMLAPSAKLTGAPKDWVGEGTRTSGGGVRTLCIGGVTLTGTELRDGFSLGSTNFSLEWVGERFQFDVYGAGHRVGMSQCGAQAMALSGATAEQILKTYYTGVEISHI